MAGRGLPEFRALRGRVASPSPALFLLIYVMITPWREFPPDPRRQHLGGDRPGRRPVGLLPAARQHHRPLRSAWSTSCCESLVALAVQVDRPCRDAPDAAGPRAGAIEADRMSAGVTAGGFRHLLRLDKRRLPYDLTCRCPRPLAPRRSLAAAHVARRQARPDGRGGRGPALFLRGRDDVAGRRLPAVFQPFSAACRWLCARRPPRSTSRRRRQGGGAAAASGSGGRDDRRPAAPTSPRASAAASARRAARAARPVPEHAPRSRWHRGQAGRTSSSSSASTTTSWTAEPYWTGAGLLRLLVRRDRPARGRHRGAAAASCLKAGRARRVEQALGAHAHPADLGRLHRTRVAALRSDDLRPLRSRLRRQWPAQAPGIQRRHADARSTRRAVVQWYWLKDVKPDADQFNSIHEKLIEAWRGVLGRLPPEGLVHFARFEGPARGSPATSEYLRDTALQAGLRSASRSPSRRSAGNGSKKKKKKKKKLHRFRRDADPGAEQALSLGMDGARGVRRAMC